MRDTIFKRGLYRIFSVILLLLFALLSVCTQCLNWLQINPTTNTTNPVSQSRNSGLAYTCINILDAVKAALSQATNELGPYIARYVGMRQVSNTYLGKNASELPTVRFGLFDNDNSPNLNINLLINSIECNARDENIVDTANISCTTQIILMASMPIRK